MRSAFKCDSPCPSANSPPRSLSYRTWKILTCGLTARSRPRAKRSSSQDFPCLVSGDHAKVADPSDIKVRPYRNRKALGEAKAEAVLALSEDVKLRRHL